MRRIISMLLCICMAVSTISPVLANSEIGTFLPMTYDVSSTSQSSTDFLVPVVQQTTVPEGYIGIYTAEDLDNVRNDPGYQYILMNDIDLSSYDNWEPITNAHISIFDGNGYTITGMNIYEENADYKYYGLFGRVLSALGTTIKNLKIIDSSIYIKSSNDVIVGAICGDVDNPDDSFINCYSNADITVISNNNIECGGITGRSLEMNYCVNMGNIFLESLTNSKGEITVHLGGCTGTGKVTNNNVNYGMITSIGGNDQYIGGIVGKGRDINNSMNFGFINVTDSEIKTLYIGGLCGETSTDGEINNCSNIGKIEVFINNAEAIIGGITGFSFSDILNCNNYADFDINNDTTNDIYITLGGICGYSNLADILYSANMGTIRINTLNSARVGGIVGNIDNLYYCYNTGDINVYAVTSAYVGGLSGGLSGYPYIENSYNIGNVITTSQDADAGGIIGGNYRAHITACYNTGNVTANNLNDSTARVGIFHSGMAGTSNTAVVDSYYLSSSMITGDEIITDGTLLTDSEFSNSENFRGFDFDTIWVIGVTESYPYPTLRNNPHITDIDTPKSEMSTTFNTSALTLSEGETFYFEGIVSTTATAGLNNLQLNINSSESNGIGINYYRAENIGTQTFNLSSVPSFIAGETVTGYDNLGNPQSIELTAGTTWYVHIFATDMDGNALGDSIKKTITIEEAEQVKPSISGLENQYTVTKGNDLKLNFTVKAGNEGSLNKVTLKHNEVGTTFAPITYELNYTTSTLSVQDLVLSGNSYPLNTIGTHEFVVYASADNYTVTDNSIAVFTITVEDTNTELSTTFDTSAITLAEGETFDFEGLVSTTAEAGLKNLQININSADNNGVGINYYRAENIGTQEFDLSSVPSFIAGETVTGVDNAGNEQKLQLTAGTTWYVHIFATDEDGNALGDSIKKHITIDEHPAAFLVGNKYIQTTYKFDITSETKPYINFTDIDCGKFYVLATDPAFSGTYEFSYKVNDDMITLTADSEYGFNGMADEIVLQIIDKKTLEVVSFKPETSGGSSYMVGWTGIGDTFELEVVQAKPTVKGLQNSYAITQGEDLKLNFSVTAGNGGKLNKVTIKHNVVGTTFAPITYELNYSTDILTVQDLILAGDMYPLNNVGTHEFVVYASADNYTVTNNSVAVFRVEVKGNTCVHDYNITNIQTISAKYLHLDDKQHIENYDVYDEYKCKLCGYAYTISQTPKYNIKTHTALYALDDNGYICVCGYINVGDYVQWESHLKESVGNQAVYNNIYNNKLSDPIGSVWHNDNIIILGCIEKNNVYYIQYPTYTGGYKYGFIKKDLITPPINTTPPLKSFNQYMVEYFIPKFYNQSLGISEQLFLQDYSTAKQIAESIDSSESYWYLTSDFSTKIKMALSGDNTLPILGDYYYSELAKPMIKSILQNIPTESEIAIELNDVKNDVDFYNKLYSYMNKVYKNFNKEYVKYTDMDSIDEILLPKLNIKYQSVLKNKNIKNTLDKIPDKYKYIISLLTEYIDYQKIKTASELSYFDILLEYFEDDPSAYSILQKYRDEYTNEMLEVPYAILEAFTQIAISGMYEYYEKIITGGIVYKIIELTGSKNISLKSIGSILFVHDLLIKISGIESVSKSEQNLVFFYWLNEAIKYDLVLAVYNYQNGNATYTNADKIVALYNVWRGIQITMNQNASNLTMDALWDKILNEEIDFINTIDILCYELSPYFVSNDINIVDYSSVTSSPASKYYDILLNGYNNNKLEEFLSGKDGIVSYWGELNNFEKHLLNEELYDIIEYAKGDNVQEIYSIYFLTTETFKYFNNSNNWASNINQYNNAVLLVNPSGCGLLFINFLSAASLYHKSFNFLSKHQVHDILYGSNILPAEMFFSTNHTTHLKEYNNYIIEYAMRSSLISYDEKLIHGESVTAISNYLKLNLDFYEYTQVLDELLDKKSYNSQNTNLCTDIIDITQRLYNINANNAKLIYWNALIGIDINQLYKKIEKKQLGAIWVQTTNYQKYLK